jgi:hypothetical protein
MCFAGSDNDWSQMTMDPTVTHLEISFHESVWGNDEFSIAYWQALEDLVSRAHLGMPDIQSPVM